MDTVRYDEFIAFPMIQALAAPQACSPHAPHSSLTLVYICLGLERTQMRAKQLVHSHMSARRLDLDLREHVQSFGFEHGVHEIIANDVPLVIWILQVVLFDVIPYPFDCLRSRALGGIGIICWTS